MKRETTLFITSTSVNLEPQRKNELFFKIFLSPWGPGSRQCLRLEIISSKKLEGVEGIYIGKCHIQNVGKQDGIWHSEEQTLDFIWSEKPDETFYFGFKEADKIFAQRVYFEKKTDITNRILLPKLFKLDKLNKVYEDIYSISKDNSIKFIKLNWHKIDFIW